MKAAVIYYSYEESCNLVANIIKEELNADIFRIETLDTKRRTGLSKYIWGCSQVFMGRKPPLKPLSVDISSYDLVILGTPVWAGSPTPAIVSFLSMQNIAGKKIAVFCCHAGGKGKALEKLKALLSGNTIIGEIDFKFPVEAESVTPKQKTGEWVKTLTR